MNKSELQKAIVASMKERNKTATSALRQVMQSVKNIEIDTRKEATEADVIAATKKLVKVTREEAEALEGNPTGREERIAMLREQIAVLEATLPRQLDGAELENLVKEGIAAVGAQTRRDTGKVMGWLTQQTNGNFNKAAAAKMIGTSLG